MEHKTRLKFNFEVKIQIILECLKGDDGILAICRRENISPIFSNANIIDYISKGNLPLPKSRDSVPLYLISIDCVFRLPIKQSRNPYR